MNNMYLTFLSPTSKSNGTSLNRHWQQLLIKLREMLRLEAADSFSRWDSNGLTIL